MVKTKENKSVILFKFEINEQMVDQTGCRHIKNQYCSSELWCNLSVKNLFGREKLSEVTSVKSF